MISLSLSLSGRSDLVIIINAWRMAPEMDLDDRPSLDNRENSRDSLANDKEYPLKT